MTGSWKGIFAIPQTPFNSKGQLDEENLRNEVDFCIQAGAHGLVAPVNASEFYVLSDHERKRITRILVEETRQRVPVIIGVTAASRDLAIMHSQIAKDEGADGVIAMPPHILKAKHEGVFEYYQGISDAVALPIFIQNAPPPLGSSLPPALMVKMCREIEYVEYIKEETLPTGHYITAIIEQARVEIKGVFGGAAGRYMLSELERGANGYMPACHLIDIYVQIWNMWQRADQAGARKLFNKLLPIINLEAILSVALAKEILVRRGVITSNYIRRPDSIVLDKYDFQEIEKCLLEIKPFLRLNEW